MKKGKLSIADMCGIIALGLSLALAIGSLFIYAHQLRANQEIILDKLQQLENADNSRHSKSKDS